MSTKFQKLTNHELHQVSGGWFSFLLLAPFALGVYIRCKVDSGACS